MNAVGERVERIEHIGSTAVPGLGAKPIIDITATIEGWERIDECIEPLEGLGYEYRPGSADVEAPWRYLEKRPDGEQAFNLHLRPVGSEEIEKNLLLCEYLRERPTATRRYEELKRDAAAEHPDDIRAYSEAKTEFIESIPKKARHERE